MIIRFTLLGVALALLGSFASFLAGGPEIRTTAESLPYSILTNALFTSIIGWGLGFWRFDPPDRPRINFIIFPAIAGFIIFQVLLHAGGLAIELEADEYVAVSLFFAIVGPFMGILIAVGFRYIPELTGLRKR